MQRQRIKKHYAKFHALCFPQYRLPALQILLLMLHLGNKLHNPTLKRQPCQSSDDELLASHQEGLVSITGQFM